MSSSIAYVPSIPAALSCRLNPFRSRSCGPPFTEVDVAFGASRDRRARFIADADSYMAGKLGAEEALSPFIKPPWVGLPPLVYPLVLWGLPLRTLVL